MDCAPSYHRGARACARALVRRATTRNAPIGEALLARRRRRKFEPKQPFAHFLRNRVIFESVIHDRQVKIRQKSNPYALGEDRGRRYPKVCRLRPLRPLPPRRRPTYLFGGLVVDVGSDLPTYPESRTDHNRPPSRQVFRTQIRWRKRNPQRYALLPGRDPGPAFCYKSRSVAADFPHSMGPEVGRSRPILRTRPLHV